MKQLGTVTLETERLILRKTLPQDAEPMFLNWAKDERVTRYLTWEPYRSVEETQNYIDFLIESQKEKNFYDWKIVLKELDEPIGAISVVSFREDIESAVIGYCLGYNFWHKGIMTEAFSAVIKFLFEQVGVNRIEATHAIENPRSGDVMKKCGLRYEGTLRQGAGNNRGIHDSCIYAILKEDYFSDDNNSQFKELGDRTNPLSEAVLDQTKRMLWEVNNVIDCVPEDLWSREYCEMPLYKHVYHMLHSLDLWFINPNLLNYIEPEFHVPYLNNLDVSTDKFLSKDEMQHYYLSIKNKILSYTKSLNDCQLMEKPCGCKHNRLKLILGQYRHLNTHMGMIMGFIIEATGQWPTVLGMEQPIPKDNNYSRFC